LQEVELRNGTRVRLQALFSAADGGAGALLDPLPELGEKRTTDHGLAEILNVIEWLEEGVVLLGPIGKFAPSTAASVRSSALHPKSLRPSKHLMTLLPR